jgi:hypothetical protein
MRNVNVAAVLIAIVAGVTRGAVVHAQDSFQVRISPLSAFVAPLKDEHHYWDGIGDPPARQNDLANQAVQRFASGAIRAAASGSAPAFAAAALQAGFTLANDATHGPDVFGTLTIDGEVVGHTAVRPDMIVPTWTGPWITRRITADSVIQLDLWDRDEMSEHDHIGVCTWTGLTAPAGARAIMAECNGRALRAEILVQPVAVSEPRVDETAAACVCRPGRRIEITCGVHGAADTDTEVTVEAHGHTTMLSYPAAGTVRVHVPQGVNATVVVPAILTGGALMDCSSASGCGCSRSDWDPTPAP